MGEKNEGRIPAKADKVPIPIPAKRINRFSIKISLKI